MFEDQEPNRIPAAERAEMENRLSDVLQLSKTLRRSWKELQKELQGRRDVYVRELIRSDDPHRTIRVKGILSELDILLNLPEGLQTEANGIAAALSDDEPLGDSPDEETDD